MNVFLLTQEDAFYIPKLIRKYLSLLPSTCSVVGAAILRGEIAAKNVREYLEFLGPSAFLKNLAVYGVYRASDVIDKIVPGDKDYSVAAVFRKKNIPVHRPRNINDNSFHEVLRSLEVSLIVSIACPQIVRTDLLELPEEGCINIHGALLPKYRGRMPSFWVLANGESETGVTVHYMNEKVDDGPIIVQRRVPIKQNDTLHSLVLRSKVGYGAEALAEAVTRIENGTVTTTPNNAEEGSYYSKPTKEAVAEFRKRGRRFR